MRNSILQTAAAGIRRFGGTAFLCSALAASATAAATDAAAPGLYRLQLTSSLTHPGARYLIGQDAPAATLLPVAQSDAGGKKAAQAETRNLAKVAASRDTESRKPAPADEPSLMLGAGDSVTMQVYGRPEMNTTTYITDDGHMAVPLAGPVHVAGLSPAQAAARISKALRDGQYLLRPHVTLTLAQMRSQQVSVLGEVREPGRFPIESRTTVFDVLAQAGGTTETGADVVYVLRPDSSGQVVRHPVDLKGLNKADGDVSHPRLQLRGGDSVYVPRADQFYIYGEVQAPNMYRLEPGMTVVQAIARGGGVTPRGSNSRIEISRKGPEGSLEEIDAEPFDVVQPNDVVRVKERIF